MRRFLGWIEDRDCRTGKCDQALCGPPRAHVTGCSTSRPAPSSVNAMRRFCRTTSGSRWGAQQDAYITVDLRGAARVAGGICATLRDLARFGEMMRNHGISKGRQVAPAWWIDDIRRNGNAVAWARGDLTKVFPNGNYRSKWYTAVGFFATLTQTRSLRSIRTPWRQSPARGCARRSAIPGWGGPRRLTMYLATLDCATSNPSLRSSPWMRGAPQRGLSMLIRRINVRRSVSICGRPPGERDFQRQ